jgi:dimethylhistidine N-methyltransferase
MMEFLDITTALAPAEATSPTPVDADMVKDVVSGLSATQKFLPSRWFYDDEGSRLFQKIMIMPSYYPSRVEHEILVRRAQDLVRWIAPSSGEVDLIELGCGDGTKTVSLCTALHDAGVPLAFHAIDVSAHALAELSTRFKHELPQVAVHALRGDYFQRWPSVYALRKQVAMFLGSNIGNLPIAQAIGLLKRIRSRLKRGDLLLLGVDLQKDPRAVLAAYNDVEGVTAQFNLNLLSRLNRELGMNFDLTAFRHYACYSPIDGAARSFLVSTVEQTVRSTQLARTFHFRAGETIYTEQSQKYTFDTVEELAASGGFTVCDHITDAREWYSISVLGAH